MLVDYGVILGIPVSMVWDATGLMNAIDLGMQVGDSLPEFNQGSAPMATTTWNTTTLCTPGVDCMLNLVSGGVGFTDDGIAGSPLVDGPFVGMNVSLDIGSGNSLTVLSVSPVPVPAAVWLFGSGLVGLLAVARRKKV